MKHSMTEPYLLYVFRRLSPKDHKSLNELAGCRYFNRREEVTRLCAHITRQLSMPLRSGMAAPTTELTLERLFEAAFPGTTYDNKVLRHTMSYLLDLIRRYLSLAEMEAQADDKAYYCCRSMRKRGLEALLKPEWQRTADALKTSPNRDARWHLRQYDLLLEQIEYRAPRERSSTIDLQPIQRHLSAYYVSEMLRHGCSALTHEAISAQPYDADLLQHALAPAADSRFLQDTPAVSLYYHLFKALREPEQSTHFESWKQGLSDWSSRFSATELRSILLLGINYCIRRMNKGDKSYTREAFDLYRMGLEKDLLREDGWLSGFTYKNIIRIGTLSGETHWVGHFFEHYKSALHPRERESLYRYNQAFLYFQQKNFARAMPLLQQLDLEDRLNLLDARRMLLRSYYELGEFQALRSLLSSFSTYLRRQKGLGYHRELNLQLLRFTGRLLELQTGPAKDILLLETDVNKCAQVAEKSWLLEKTAQLLQPRRAL